MHDFFLNQRVCLKRSCLLVVFSEMVAGRYKIVASHPDLIVEAKGSQEVLSIIFP